MAERRELGADLAAPAGTQAQLEHGRAGTALAHAVLRDRLAATPASRPHAQRRRVLDDAVAQRAGIVAHAALHHGHVTALDGARGELRLQRALHRGRLREHEKSRGLAIQAVDDEQSCGRASRRRRRGTPVRSRADVVGEQPVERSLALPRRADGEEAGRLFDDEQIVVLVHEPQRGGKRRRRRAEGDARGVGNVGVAATDDDAVHPHAPGREPGADGRARGVGKEALQAVEQAAQRGGRGPSTSVTGAARYVVAARCTSAAVTACTARRYRSGYSAPTPSTS